MPVDILVYAIVAAVMVFWLRSVLGTRHGEERQRPNPFEQQTNTSGSTEISYEDDMIELEPLQTEGISTDAGLVQIALVDKNFDAKEFRDNAKEAFIIIVEAFANGDRETLRELCNDDVYKAFTSAIDDREKVKETVSTDIHAVRKIEITHANLEQKRHAFITLKITAEETYVIRDKNDVIIAGHPDRITEMTDQWTFTRDLKSKDPRWLLCKTEDDEVEVDGKTPLPDAG